MSATGSSVNNRKLSDNDKSANNGNRNNSSKDELISQENSLSPRVLTTIHSSMGTALRSKPAHNTSSLNQDLLQFSNYLNAKCNQPDSESQNKNERCKQFDRENVTMIVADRLNTHSPSVSFVTQTSSSATNIITSLPKELLDNRNPIEQLNNINKFETISTTATTATATNRENILTFKENFALGHQVTEDNNKNEHAILRLNETNSVVMGLMPNEKRDRWPVSNEGLSATCESIIYRNIHWPRTTIGSVATQPCPHKASGKLLTLCFVID